jgi:hypothetical protein
MATLPQTVTALESVAGRDHATLTQYGRIIREAGLLPRGKRGAGAPQMTPENIAILMLGMYFSDTPKDAALTAERLRAYKLVNVEGSEDFAAAFAGLGECQHFGEALATLIASQPDLVTTFEGYIETAYAGYSATAIAALKADLHSVVSLSVAVNGINAEIECHVDRVRQWKASYSMDLTKWAAGEYGFAASDRRVSASFGLRSLQVAYQCSKGEAF